MAAMLRCAYMLLEVPKAPGGRRRQTWLDGWMSDGRGWNRDGEPAGTLKYHHFFHGKSLEYIG